MSDEPGMVGDARRIAVVMREIERLPEDLRPLAIAIFDLGYYRTQGELGEDLATAVAHELAVRVSELPEVRAL